LLSTIQTKSCPCFLVYCTTATKLNMTMRRRIQADFKAVALILSKILLPFVKTRLNIRNRKGLSVVRALFGQSALLYFYKAEYDNADFKAAALISD